MGNKQNANKVARDLTDKIRKARGQPPISDRDWAATVRKGREVMDEIISDSRRRSS